MLAAESSISLAVVVGKRMLLCNNERDLLLNPAIVVLLDDFSICMIVS